MEGGRLRGAASGGALPPEPPAGAFAPGPQKDAYQWGMSDVNGSGMPRRSLKVRLSRHTRAINRCINHAPSINCRGSGGRLATQRGARGAEPAHMRQSAHAASTAGSARGGARSQSDRADTSQRGARGAEPARRPCDAYSEMWPSACAQPMPPPSPDTTCRPDQAHTARQPRPHQTS
jgi:hypothetical protein